AATASSTPSAPTCCGGLAAPARPCWPTRRRSPAPTTPPSAPSWSAGGGRSRARHRGCSATTGTTRSPARQRHQLAVDRREDGDVELAAQPRLREGLQQLLDGGLLRLRALVARQQGGW